MNSVLTLALAGIQTLVVVVTAIFAWVNIRKFKDSRGIDFVLNAENQIDPIYQNLTHTSPSVIRSIYANYDLSGLSEDECQALPFMHSLYLHVSRITYITSNSRLDLGLTRLKKDTLLRLWFAHLGTFRNHPAMRIVHQTSVRVRDVNDTFLHLAAVHLGAPAPNAGSESNALKTERRDAQL